MQCLIFKNQILLFPFRQRKGHKQNQGLQLKAQYDNSLALDTPLLQRKMVLYIVYFFTFWQLLYDFNKDCKQMFLVLTLFLSQAPSSLLLCCSLAFLHRAAKGLSWGKRRQCKPWACRKVQGRQGCQHLSGQLLWCGTFPAPVCCSGRRLQSLCAPSLHSWLAMTELHFAKLVLVLCHLTWQL